MSEISFFAPPRPRRAKGAPRSRQAPAPAVRSLRVAHRRGGRLAAPLRKNNDNATQETEDHPCESTFTTESLKQMLPKGFVRANTDLNGVADLTEEDITTSITCTKGSTTARLVAMTIRAGLERECWVAEIAIPEAFVDGHVKLSRRLPILATPGLPRFQGRKLQCTGTQ